MRTARWAPLGFVPLVPIVLALLRDRLPDPLAVHWSGAGHANGHQTLVSFGVLMVVVWLVVRARRAKVPALPPAPRQGSGQVPA